MNQPSRTPFRLLLLLLIGAGVLLSVYRHLTFDVPWLPGEKHHIWSVEAKISFRAEGVPVKVSFAIPDSQPGFAREAEHTASAGYGLAYVEGEEGDKPGRRAEWSIRSASGQQVLYYRVDMLVDPSQRGEFSPPPPVKAISDFGPYATAARAMLEQAQKRSADAVTLARELIREFNNQSQSTQLLLQKRSRSSWLVALLQEGGVAAREVSALALEDGRRRQSLTSYVQVFDAAGGRAHLFHPRRGQVRDSEPLLLWEYNGQPLLDLLGGSRGQVSFSIIEQEVPLGETRAASSDEAVQRLNQSRSFMDLSIHSLPLEEQTLFKGILLLPVGVLVVVFMRVFVGLRTSGTFMPVLIAIAFIQTRLVTGLVGFVLIVSLGLMIRSYLSQLNLLLVARIGTVIISVIILIAVFSVISYQLGLSEGLKVTFFPMIILSWTIERMSILWEEEGASEVFKQTGGSLAVAVLAYLLMTNEVLRHLTFNFLGLQLVFIAIILLLGTYTGYRLLELRRFRPLSEGRAGSAHDTQGQP